MNDAKRATTLSSQKMIATLPTLSAQIAQADKKQVSSPNPLGNAYKEAFLCLTLGIIMVSSKLKPINKH
jgi:hypothetical protein